MIKLPLRLVSPATVNRTVATPRRKPTPTTHPRASDRGRGRAPDQGRRQEPPRPPRRHHDPGRLPPRPAVSRADRPALGSDRLQRRDPACPPGQAGHAGDASDPRRRTARPAPAAARAGAQVAVRVHLERGSPFTTAGFARMVERAGVAAGLGFKAHPHMLRHACGYALANKGHDTRALQAYLGHRNIQHTVRYTELSATRFKDFWRDRDKAGMPGLTAAKAPSSPQDRAATMGRVWKHGRHMRRRQFIAGVGATAVLGARGALGQQAAMPVIGFLHTGASQSYAQQMAAFHRGLGELGYVPGRNVMIDHRWAENRLDRLPELAADLVRKRVNVIAPAGGPAAVSAAIAATGLIPIVFSLGSDPVRLGFVPSLNRPGGNVTGVVFLTNDLEAKRMELLCEMLPGVQTIGYLVNPTNPNANAAINGVQAAAQMLGRQLFVVQAGVDGDFDAAIKTLVEHRADALLVSPDALFTNRAKQLASSALSARLPAIDQLRGFPDRRLGQLWCRPFRHVSSTRHLRRSHSQGRQTGRVTGDAAGQVRTRDKSQDSEGARPHSSAEVTLHRRRGS